MRGVPAVMSKPPPRSKFEIRDLAAFGFATMSGEKSARRHQQNSPRS
jgi:hypothetical protein